MDFFVSGGDGDDVISTLALTKISQSSAIQIYGDAGNDRIATGTIISSGSGTLVIAGGQGSDTIDIGAVTGSEFETQISGGTESDFITIGEITGAIVLGEDGNDVIKIGAIADSFVNAGRGNDVISGLGDTNAILFWGFVTGNVGTDTCAVTNILGNVTSCEN